MSARTDCRPPRGYVCRGRVIAAIPTTTSCGGRWRGLGVLLQTTLSTSITYSTPGSTVSLTCLCVTKVTDFSTS